MIINNPEACPVVISHMGNDGKLKPIQPLSDFVNGERSPQVVCALCGKELFDILYDDLGYIPFDDKNFISICKHIKKNHKNQMIMQKLGRIAESVIVRRCSRDEKLNQKWMEIASLRSRVSLDKAKEFKAYGTGLLSTTKRMWVYNPNDTQKDIIWVNKEDARFMVNGSSSVAGNEAGIQVKVSQNGANYVFQDIVNRRYGVPLVYFDLSDDYHKLFVNAQRLFTNVHPNTSALNDLACYFIRGRDIDPDAHYEIGFYSEIISALIEGKLREEDFVQHAKEYPSIGQAIKGTADVILRDSSLLVPQIFES